MLKEYNRFKVLKEFLDKPLEEFGLRELSRLADIAPLSVMRYLKDLISKELIQKYIKKGKPVYQALRENEDFIFYKKLSILYDLHTSGLIDELWYKLSPEAIIFYGSHAKGEATEDSDIDLFIIGKEKNIDLMTFEKILQKQVHLIIESHINNLSSELKNNLVNGIVLKGYFKIF